MSFFKKLKNFQKNPCSDEKPTYISTMSNAQKRLKILIDNTRSGA